MPRSLFTDAYGYLVRALVDERRAAGLRQVDLAKRLGKPQSFVSKMETGERRLDVIEFLVVARAMDADPVAIIAKLAAEVSLEIAI